MQAVIITISAVSAIALIRFLCQNLYSVVVHDHEAGLLLSRGRVSGLLSTGRHWLWRRTSELHLVDTRLQLLTVSAQEVLTKDGVPVKISLTASYQVTDVRTALTTVDCHLTALYLAAQLALRDCSGRLELEELLGERGALDASLTDSVQAEARLLGIEVRRLAVKDLMVGGDLKRALTEVARARAEGRAKLERARGETAALRNLTNAARLLEEHGGLRDLRLLETAQAVAAGEGNSLVLGLGGDLRGLRADK